MNKELNDSPENKINNTSYIFFQQRHALIQLKKIEKFILFIITLQCYTIGYKQIQYIIFIVKLHRTK